MDQSQILNRNYGVWPPPPPLGPLPPPDDPITFQTSQRPLFAARTNWKGKNSDKRINTGAGAGGGGYKPPKLNELQTQNRAKVRRFYPKKKFNNRFAPFAPRNTSSYIIRAKKSGGIAPLVSPCPVTPAILPTPIFSPSREVLVDMAKEEWGVDGYGSMKGLIRLRPSQEAREDDEDEDSDVEEVEKRLDHDLSRFEMIYPNCGDEQLQQTSVLENRVDDQDTQIAQLEEENLTLKERLFLMERELEDLRRRVQCLETDGARVRDNNNNNNEEASDNDGGAGDVCSEKSVGDGDADSQHV